MTTSSEIEVALRSSRTRTTVPSRISRTIGSLASEREFHASQSPFTLRHTRLTVSLPTSPPNTLRSARRTRRVLVPARYRMGRPRAAQLLDPGQDLIGHEPGETAWECQHDGDEEPAHGEQPQFRKALREQRLAPVDEERSADRADQRVPAADGAEDHH